MVEILLQRTIGAFVSIDILFFLVTAQGREINGFRQEEVAMTMKLESLANATRYQWIERFMRTHLQNDPEADNSFLHVLVHPKVNPRLSEAVIKACIEAKPAVIWKDEKNSVSNGCIVNETCSRITRVVGIYEEVDDIKPLEWKNSYGVAWNPRSKIAIWLGRSTGNDDSTDKVKFEEILESFWSINAVNVAIFTTPLCKSDKNCSATWKPRVFGYNPFVYKSGRSEKRGKLLERSIDDPLFPDKLKNLHGLPIRISMYQQEPHTVLINYTQLGSGVEVDTLRYIASWLNFTVELISAPTTFTSYSIQLPDGENFGPVGDILKNRSVYLANSEYVQTTLGKRVEFLRPFGRAYAKFIVPPAGLMPGIFRIFRSIDTAVGVAAFLNCLFLMCYFIARKKRYPILRTFHLMMHQQIEDISENSSERIFLIFWIFWAFILSTAGQSQLIKDLTDPPFYKSIDTLQELTTSPLTPMLEQVDINSLRYSDVEVKNRLAEKSILEDNFAKCTEILLNYRNVSCAIDSMYIQQVVKNLADKRDRKRGMVHRHRRGEQEIVHVVKDILTEYWKTIVVQEGFPYFDKFNDAYDTMIEMGLDKKWLAESTRQHFEINPPTTMHPKLSMDHFEGTFKILLFGLGVASVILIIEIIFHHAKRRLKNNSFCSKGLRIFTVGSRRSRTSKSQSIRKERSISLKKMESK